MFGALARRLFGSANDRYLKSLSSLVAQINELEPALEKLTPEELFLSLRLPSRGGLSL